jgi:CelD/BcsL family acetyltransferase involved in cellulose biosynthesis
MPWCRIDDVRGARVVGLPFSDFCGPLLAAPDAWEPLANTLSAHEMPVRFRSLDAGPLLVHPNVTQTGRLHWHGIDVAAGADVARRAYAPAARRGVHHAERAGVHTELLSDAQLDEFIALHVGVRKHKYGLLAQPHAFFDALRAHFTAVDGWFPLAARHEDKVIAVTVYLRWRDTLYYKFNASHPDALPLRPNNLLVDAGIELACVLGCRRLDFGASDEDQPGLVRFKRQFGAEEGLITALSIGGQGDDPRDVAARRVLAAMQAIFCDAAVPDAVTAKAGDLLYRYFA